MIQGFTLPPLHRAGWPFVAISAVIWAFLAWLLGGFGFVIGMLATAWVAYFFRDPERVTPQKPGLVISPADGKVIKIEDAVPPAELGMGSEALPRISIFLNLFDVHVNRVPMDGSVVAIHYRPGTFLNAAMEKASEENERMAIRHKLPDGREIAYVQIAGLVARRIICNLVVGQQVKAGERFGLIRFGSRADIYLPKGTVPNVLIGQLAVAGETVLADLGTVTPLLQATT